MLAEQYRLSVVQLVQLQLMRLNFYYDLMA